MEYQMGQMRLDRQPLRMRLAKNRLAGEDDVAEDRPQPAAGTGRSGEGQDVGRTVYFTEIAVEAADMGVVGEDQRKLAIRRQPRPDCSDGGVHNFCGKRRKLRLRRPVAGLDQKIDGDRPGLRLRFPAPRSRRQIPSPRLAVEAAS